MQKCDNCKLKPNGYIVEKPMTAGQMINYLDERAVFISIERHQYGFSVLIGDCGQEYRSTAPDLGDALWMAVKRVEEKMVIRRIRERGSYTAASAS